MVWCGVVWCGVVWCGGVGCGVLGCGVVWCGVMACRVRCGGYESNYLMAVVIEWRLAMKWRVQKIVVVEREGRMEE